MAGWRLERGGHLGRFGAGAHQPLPAAPAKRKGQRRHEDRLARARFAGERGESAGKLEPQVADQHEIANGKRCEHVLTPKCPLGSGITRVEQNGNTNVGRPANPRGRQGQERSRDGVRA
jgi:hypothetical protein